MGGTPATPSARRSAARSAEWGSANASRAPSPVIERAFSDGPDTKEAAVEQAQRAAREAVDAFRQNHEWRALYPEFVAQAHRDPRFRKQLALRSAACRDMLTRVVESRAEAIGLALPIPAEQLAVGIEGLAHGLATQG